MATKLYASERLKQLRLEKRLSQKDLVNIINMVSNEKISIHLVQSIEQGRRTVSPDLLLEFANYFKVEPTELAVRK